MNLWLSPLGVWYYRKVTILPCGRRKDMKKSLGTRDKRLAREKVVLLLACSRSRVPDSPVPHAPAASAKKVKVKSDPLSITSDQYQREKALSWSPSERRNQRGYINYFIKVVGDKPASDYSKAEVVRFKEGLLTSGRSPTTINKYIQKLSLLFTWLSNHHDGVVNHFSGIKLQRAKEVNPRSGYTPVERQTFLRWAYQQEGHRKWLSLLGMFTGARANELCQLYADDVQQVSGIWVLNIRAGRPDQKLKTANSARMVPLHSQVLAAGFLDFCKGRAGGRLFTELSYRADCYSHAWGQQFRRYRPVDKDFHSLRHTVASALKDSGAPLQYAAAILGHTNGAISYDRYGGGVAVERLRDALEAALGGFLISGASGHGVPYIEGIDF